ncbi:uncharacterized protein LOC127842673 [Dreissena polymorpha]|uniref:Uncharacterized protein n=1 Tax=Dreissena polymorpha TaxID=45954 RepID=A0A9D4N2A0_DREPO|nr:uncharacterized protein LOC127842673 [Dreissena polymorpha]KAH3886495.1 hypothetical protein DPMN_010505 [Dreissena polymorpha]
MPFIVHYIRTCALLLMTSSCLMCFLLQRDTCAEDRLVDQVTIPDGIPRDVFDQKFLEVILGELYFGLPTPPAFEPDVRYFAKIHRLNQTHYERRHIAETPASSSNPSSCANETQIYGIIETANESVFYVDASDIPDKEGLVFWSSCPERYVWSMRCSGYRLGMRHCPAAKAKFGLYIKGTPNNLPLALILRDLEQTRVQFDSTQFHWVFTYGENRLCGPL